MAAPAPAAPPTTPAHQSPPMPGPASQPCHALCTLLATRTWTLSTSCCVSSRLLHLPSTYCDCGSGGAEAATRVQALADSLTTRPACAAARHGGAAAATHGYHPSLMQTWNNSHLRCPAPAPAATPHLHRVAILVVLPQLLLVAQLKGPVVLDAVVAVPRCGRRARGSQGLKGRTAHSLCASAAVQGLVPSAAGLTWRLSWQDEQLPAQTPLQAAKRRRHKRPAEATIRSLHPTHSAPPAARWASSGAAGSSPPPVCSRDKEAGQLPTASCTPPAHCTIHSHSAAPCLAQLTGLTLPPLPLPPSAPSPPSLPSATAGM